MGVQEVFRVCMVLVVSLRVGVGFTAMCQCPQAPRNGYTAGCTGNGTYVSYYCEDGYRLIGVTRRTCTSSGNWSDSAPTCSQSFQCLCPPAPTNGSTSGCTGNGTSVSYSCNRGYRRIGDSKRMCTSGGIWSNSAPTCQPRCSCPRNLRKGWTSGCFISNGSKLISYYCNDGYRLVGDRTRTCISPKVWSGNSPTCQKVKCQCPPAPTNGSTSGCTGNGVKVSYSCDSGYRLIGDNKQTCTSNGSWSNSAPTCQLSVRLVGGSTPNEGRVEVYYNGIWGTVCDDFWSNTDGNVVCRMLGYRIAISSSRHFGQGTGRIWLDNVHCLGRENSLFDCYHNGWGRHDCDHYDDAGVVCEDLCPCPQPPSNGSTSGCIGKGYHISYSCDSGYHIVGDSSRMCISGIWSGNAPTCSNAVCPCPQSPSNGSTSGCTGNGTSVSYDCDRGYGLVGDSTRWCTSDVVWSGSAPTCQIGVRLVGGSTPNEGRVEVYYNGTWGTVCHDAWSNTEGTVVCRMLGYRIAISSWRQFGRGTGRIWLDNVYCSGKEDSLFNCSHRGWGRHNCNHYDDVGVVCEDSCPCPQPPSNGSTSGCIEKGYHISYSCDSGYHIIGDSSRLCIRGIWSGNASTCSNAVCPCPQPPSNGSTSGCTGNGTSVSYDCDRGYGLVGDSTRWCTSDVVWSGSAPTCQIGVRLVGGSTPNEGRVEVYYNGTWGTVCDDAWSNTDGNVVCRMLGYRIAISSSRHFGQGTGRIWLDDVGCSGEESSLFNCSHRGWGRHYCNHYEDAGVECEDSCPCPQPPSNGSTSGCIGKGYHISYSCDSGYHIIGNSSRMCIRGIWSGDAPTCSNAVCPCPQPPSNGYTSGCTGNGTSVSYDCDRGYGLVGDSTRWCTSNVVWSGSAPTCQNVRLVGGNSPNEGRVEVYYNGIWGTVCEDYWSNRDGNVVCRMLGYRKAILSSRHFSRGTGRIWLDDVRCSGEEDSLFDCSHRGWGRHNCNHYDDAGVLCEDVCPCPQPPSNGSTSGCIGKGYHISYSCDSGYHLVGDSSRLCIRGIWSGDAPTCSNVLDSQSTVHIGALIGSLVAILCTCVVCVCVCCWCYFKKRKTSQPQNATGSSSFQTGNRTSEQTPVEIPLSDLPPPWTPPCELELPSYAEFMRQPDQFEIVS